MDIITLRTQQNLPVSIEDAWKFFSNPENLARITPSKLGFEITSGRFEKMYQGMIITYKVKPLLNIPLRWVTEITHMKEPFYFVDEQRFGPYKFWHHQHIFEETDNGVLMKDIVNYSLPFGFLGKIVNKLVVANNVKDIFSYRKKILEKMFTETNKIISE